MNDPALHWQADPQALGLLQLRDDPLYARIPSGRRAALVEAALGDGRATADRVLEHWGADPAVIATRCRLPVIRSEDDAGFGSVVVFAEYATQPPAITLYLPAIRRLDRLVARHSALAGGMGSTAAIFLAHELYHYFDCLRGNARLSRRYAVKIFGIGRWHWSSGLSSLAEIAAGAFAQHLLGLRFHPKLLDLLLVQEDQIRTIPELRQPS